MHKGMILLTKAEDADDAIANVESFLENYGEGNVWDWYDIGGRWTGLLSGYDPADDPENQETCNLCGGTGFRTDQIGKSARVEQPTYTCNGCGEYNQETKEWGHGKYGPGVKLKWPTSWVKHHGDAMPLSLCLPKVQEWARDLKKTTQEFLYKMNEELEAEKANPDGYKMSGYYARQYADDIGGYFCFNTNVYDVELGEAESIPEDTTGYWAVVCDLHN